VIAISNGCGCHTADCITPGPRFRHSQCTDHFTTGAFWQVFEFLVLAAISVQIIDEQVFMCGVAQAERGIMPGKSLNDEAMRNEVHPRAAIFRRYCNAQKTGLTDTQHTVFRPPFLIIHFRKQGCQFLTSVRGHGAFPALELFQSRICGTRLSYVRSCLPTFPSYFQNHGYLSQI
jgi:hypothetical protein